MSTDIHASFVTFNGEVGGRANGDLISRSYGSPVMNYGDDVSLVGSSGGIISSGYGLGNIGNSYGLFLSGW